MGKRVRYLHSNVNFSFVNTKHFELNCEYAEMLNSGESTIFIYSVPTRISFLFRRFRFVEP